MHDIDTIIIGAGAVGLAVARRLARAGCEVLVLEAEDDIGTGISSRNSEVIHAGIYYAAGSLMARLCVSGRDMLYAYCESRGVPYRRCGKLIVATDDDENIRLAAIRDRAAVNGVTDLREISATEARKLEPALACAGALLSPSTGIFNAHAFMLALSGEIEDAGGAIALRTPFQRATPGEGGFIVQVGGAEPMQLRGRRLVNSAGLAAPLVAGAIDAMPAKLVPERYFARGNYFALSGRSPFSRLIYPVPVPGGLGVHLTLDMGGQARFGPDVEWIDTISYDVDPARAESFYPAIRRYWPGLADGALTPAYAGIRPKIVPPDVAVQDFVIQGPQAHGIAGLVNLFGIESPGLTAALSIADEVASQLGG